MTALLALILLAQDETIQQLRDKDEVVRENAARICGRKGFKTAIPYLIELLAEDKYERVRTASVDSLEILTGRRDLGADYKKWKDWWTNEGSKEFPATILTKQEIKDILDPHVRQLNTEITQVREDIKKDVDRAKTEIRMLSFFVAGIAIFFVVIMIYFVGHVSSKLKEWKDFMRQAEHYVNKGEEITRRTDKVLEELDSKKTEIFDFAKKQREDLQTEIERYTDLLQENTEHQLREEVMGLRQKAEKELEQTLGELRMQVEHEIRRGAGGYKESLEKEFQLQRERFLQEVQVHTLFLEASFFTIHGKNDDALRQLKKLVAIRPEHHLAWLNLGNVYRELLRYDESLEAYNHALTIAPNDSRILYNIAATYARLKRKESMLETLARAVANDGEYKDEALNDAAFREYWNDPQFKDLAEA